MLRKGDQHCRFCNNFQPHAAAATRDAADPTRHLTHRDTAYRIWAAGTLSVSSSAPDLILRNAGNCYADATNAAEGREKSDLKQLERRAAAREKAAMKGSRLSENDPKREKVQPVAPDRRP